MMKYEIVTHPIKKDEITAELDFFAGYCINLGYEYCEILFGFSWGNDYYETNNWEFENISLENLLEKVASVEASGLGELGDDDLYIKLPGESLEFRFCNDSDIHISFNASDEITEYFYNRWKSLGYSPAEWLKGKGESPNQKLR